MKTTIFKKSLYGLVGSVLALKDISFEFEPQDRHPSSKKLKKVTAIKK